MSEKMSFQINKENYRHILFMIVSVICMGFSLSVLVMTNFGTDPCSAMNYGVSGAITKSGVFTISFGSYQLLMNLCLLIFVLFLKRSLIGWGTLGNMILVGYTADFFTWFWHEVCKIPFSLPLFTRLILLVPGLIIFVISAACYMNSNQGMAPYDAIPFILSEKVTEKTGKNHFRIIRLMQDFLCTMIGVFTGGTYGLITFLMVATLGPAVQAVGDIMNRRRKNTGGPL